MSTSPWMKKFLSAPFFAWKDRNKPYGEPNELFDGLQIVLSHLVLDPYSPFALTVPTSRGDYEIAKVYLWDQPFETIYRRAPEREPGTHHSPIPSPILFPKLKSRSPEPEPPMYLDLHSLLHIRNFWRRHFMAKEDATYFDMAEALIKTENAPQKWHRGLQEPLVLETKWVGHYSCLHPWPKKIDKFEETQCCAEDWHDHGIDPLVCVGRTLLSFSVRTRLSFRCLPTGHHSPSTFIERTHRATCLPRLPLLSRPSTSPQLPTTRLARKQAIGRQSSALSPPSPPRPHSARAHHIPIFAASPRTSTYPARQQTETISPAPKRQNTIPSLASVSAAWFIQSRLLLQPPAPITAF
jgi:hypothetical protein